MRTNKPIYVAWFVCFVLVLMSVKVRSSEVIWKLDERWTVSQNGIISAIEGAKQHFKSFPNDSILILIPEGTYNIGGNDDHSIDISDVIPGTDGRLIFKGVGKEKTVFIASDRKEHSIYGRNMYRITFEGIHFTRDYCCVPQGTVVSSDIGEVVIDLHDGFPAPDSLWQYGIVGSWGMYFKKYTDDIDNPQILVDDNDQIAWDKEGTYQIEGKRWRFALKNSTQLANYKAGDIVGIKLKHGGQTYWFANGDDISFVDCKWTQKTRGVLRTGISNISFINCVTERGPRVGGRVPCLASPDGGPQCGQPNDEVIHNVFIDNCTFIASGDDNVAFFNVNGGTIRNCTITDSFARGILLYHCENICLENNVVERCPILWEEGDGYSKCDDPTGMINDLQNDSKKVKIYPNPFEENFVIQTNGLQSTCSQLNIFDTKGALVFNNVVDRPVYSVDFSEKQKGMYYLQLKNENNLYKQVIIKL